MKNQITVQDMIKPVKNKSNKMADKKMMLKNQAMNQKTNQKMINPKKLIQIRKK